MPLSDKDIEEFRGRAKARAKDSEPGILPHGGSAQQGLVQSALGLAEAPAQWAEKGIQQFSPDFQIVSPDVRNWAREYKHEAESTPQGILGEAAGDIGMMYVPGLDIIKGAQKAQQAYKAAKAAGPALKAIGGPAWKAVAAPTASTAQKALTAGTVATLQQPVSGRDFNAEKMEQFFGGVTLHGLAQAAAKLPPAAAQAAGHMLGHSIGIPAGLSHFLRGLYSATGGAVSAVGRHLADKPLVTGAMGGQAPKPNLQQRTGNMWSDE